MGNDAFVRAANVRIGNYVTSKPISKLYPLQVSSTDSKLQGEIAREEFIKQSADLQPTDINEKCPRRRAAKKARSQIRFQNRQRIPGGCQEVNTVIIVLIC